MSQLESEKLIQKWKKEDNDTALKLFLMTLTVALSASIVKFYIDSEEAKKTDFYPELNCGNVTEMGYIADITKQNIKLNIANSNILAFSQDNEMIIKTKEPFKLVDPLNPTNVRVDENGLHLDSTSSVLVNINGANYLIEGLPDYEGNKYIRLTAECSSN